MTKVYRQGAIGALMDEYERAANELIDLVGTLDESAFVALRDSETKDPDCKSVQTVMQHVARAGFGYANYIRTAWLQTQGRKSEEVRTPEDAAQQVRAMLAYMEETLKGRWTLTDDEITAVSMTVSWGPTYDLEQLLEHAIVHVLRHRRQIERFLSEPRFLRHVST